MPRETLATRVALLERANLQNEEQGKEHTKIDERLTSIEKAIGILQTRVNHQHTEPNGSRLRQYGTLAGAVTIITVLIQAGIEAARFASG